MKMIVAVIQDVDNDPVSQALLENGFHVTRIASTGGFFKKGCSTLLVGVEDDQVDKAIQKLKECTTPPEDRSGSQLKLFVLMVDHFTQV